MRPRPAFTLVELLVVIAIIGVLVALLLPAVQAAREAANRMSCGNNLKNLGLACHNYHDVHKRLPLNYATGGAVFNYPSPADVRMTSWMTQALPFMEQQPLYDMIDFAYTDSNDPRNGGNYNAPNNPSNAYSARTVVASYLCPSSGTEERMAGRHNHGGGGGTAELAMNNYRGVCGSNWVWGNFQTVGTPWGSSAWTTSGDGLNAGNGFFFRGHGRACSTRFAQATDGLSNTFMVGEGLPQHDEHSGWIFFNYVTGTCAVPLNAKAQCQNTGNVEADSIACDWDWPNNYSFQSRHPGGAQFCLGDGHVVFVSETVSLDVYRSIGTMDRGETAQLP